jgi:hypothetical protein
MAERHLKLQQTCSKADLTLHIVRRRYVAVFIPATVDIHVRPEVVAKPFF